MTQLDKTMNKHRRSANFRLAMEFRQKAHFAKGKDDKKVFWKIAFYYLDEHRKEI